MVEESAFFSPFPESILACFLAAHSSIFSLQNPSETALAMPPISSIWNTPKSWSGL